MDKMRIDIHETPWTNEAGEQVDITGQPWNPNETVEQRIGRITELNKQDVTKITDEKVSLRRSQEGWHPPVHHEFEPSKATAAREDTQHGFVLNIHDNPKRSGIILAVDHNQIADAQVRVDVWGQGHLPDYSKPMDGAMKGWSFRANYAKRRYRSRLVDGAIQLRGRAALVFCKEIETELLRKRNVFVTLLVKHGEGARYVRFAINPDPEELVQSSHIPNSGDHSGAEVTL